jgi:hypothetical protein
MLCDICLQCQEIHKVDLSVHFSGAGRRFRSALMAFQMRRVRRWAFALLWSRERRNAALSSTNAQALAEIHDVRARVCVYVCVCPPDYAIGKTAQRAHSKTCIRATIS